MAIFEYPEKLLIIPLMFLLFYSLLRRGKTNSEPTNWPVVGMLPAILQNLHRGHDHMTEILNEHGGTLEVKGVWFSNLNMLLTSDPANIHYIFSRNFTNYPKGPEFRKIFDILGDGIFNSDNELWELHRKTTLSVMTGPRFYSFLERTVWHKVETGLLPVLEYFSEHGNEFDLQDIFQRFTFDNICMFVFEYDPKSLSIDLPYIPCEKAFSNVNEPLMLRHLVPESIWKLQKWLKIGNEKKLLESSKAFDEFIYPLIEKQQKGGNLNLLTAFEKVYKEASGRSPAGLRTFLRDTSVNLMFAGRDTTSTCLTWLFWLISIHPLSEIKILEEIESILHVKQDRNWRFFDVEESRKLVYLHGALCESLRLFPPVALEHKAPMCADTLPSGHYLHENKKLIVSFYSVGRMENVWGKDCLEFKPERWITDRGGIKYEPSYKFPAFNVGPRTCLGKEMAFVQMKMVASAIIYHYKVQLVEGHLVSPRVSIILQAKHGLRVRLSRRNID